MWANSSLQHGSFKQTSASVKDLQVLGWNSLQLCRRKTGSGEGARREKVMEMFSHLKVEGDHQAREEGG